MINIRQFFGFGLFLLSLTIYGQSFDKKISSSELKLPDRTVEGFSTSLDFSSEKVILGWWKYAKKFALPKNLRTHYEVTIPSTETARKVVIYTQAEGENKPIVFKLAIKSNRMTKEEKQKYSKQAKAMLLDFKRWYYLRHYEEKLKNLEKELPSSATMDWTVWMDYVEKRDKILKKIKGI
jgi:hypothetical protein